MGIRRKTAADGGNPARANCFPTETFRRLDAQRRLRRTVALPVRRIFCVQSVFHPWLFERIGITFDVRGFPFP
jgi:hypothetical protein